MRQLTSSSEPSELRSIRFAVRSLPGWLASSLLIEINQPGDYQASLVYAVDIDNIDPRTFQLLDLVGYPKREEDDDEGEEVWALYYVDGSFDSALKLIDSALLTIERGY